MDRYHIENIKLAKSQPLGLIVEITQKKKRKKKQKRPKNLNIDSVQSKATHYKMINGKIVEVEWKD